MNRRLFAGVVLAVSLGASCSPAFATTAVKKPTPTTIPTIRTPAGKLYKSGEFCPKVDLGKRSHGTSGIIKCEVVGKSDRWETV